MKPVQQNQRRVTLVLHTEEGDEWPLSLSADCARFIGHYPRLPAFGPAMRLFVFV